MIMSQCGMHFLSNMDVLSSLKEREEEVFEDDEVSMFDDESMCELAELTTADEDYDTVSELSRSDSSLTHVSELSDMSSWSSATSVWSFEEDTGSFDVPDEMNFAARCWITTDHFQQIENLRTSQHSRFTTTVRNAISRTRSFFRSMFLSNRKETPQKSQEQPEQDALQKEACRGKYQSFLFWRRERPPPLSRDELSAELEQLQEQSTRLHSMQLLHIQYEQCISDLKRGYHNTDMGIYLPKYASNNEQIHFLRQQLRLVVRREKAFARLRKSTLKSILRNQPNSTN